MKRLESLRQTVTPAEVAETIEILTKKDNGGGGTA
jgi:hypothetical protein